MTYDALVYCDMTTGPAGETVSFADRMDEIERRHGPDHEVTCALELGREDLTRCCCRTLNASTGLMLIRCKVLAALQARA